MRIWIPESSAQFPSPRTGPNNHTTLKQDRTVNLPKSCFNKTCQQQQQQTRLSKCGKCLIAHYCSRECQRADWNFHKTTCCKPQGLESGGSVAVGKIPSSDPLKLTSPFLAIDGQDFASDYELHGALWAPILRDPVTGTYDAERKKFINDGKVHVRLYIYRDGEMCETAEFIDVSVENVILSGWDLP